MRSLRARLFIAILGTVLVAVGASLALGVVLTKSAVRETIRNDVESQAETLAAQIGRLPPASRRQLRGSAGLPPGAPPAGAPPRGTPGGAPPPSACRPPPPSSCARPAPPTARPSSTGAARSTRRGGWGARWWS